MLKMSDSPVEVPPESFCFFGGGPMSPSGEICCLGPTFFAFGPFFEPFGRPLGRLGGKGGVEDMESIL